MTLFLFILGLLALSVLLGVMHGFFDREDNYMTDSRRLSFLLKEKYPKYWDKHDIREYILNKHRDQIEEEEWKNRVIPPLPQTRFSAESLEKILGEKSW
jgi:hypothetical protein